MNLASTGEDYTITAAGSESLVFDNFFSSATSTLMVVTYLFHGNDFEFDASATFEGMRAAKPTRRRPQHLCVDKGYAGKAAEKQMRDRGYTPHVPAKGTLKAARHRPRGKARRWVVERTHSWMNNFRKLRVRYEKKAANFEGLLHLATALICWRM